MRRVSMTVLKATARHTLHGLEMIVPRAMRQHSVRRALSLAAREADFDEHRADVCHFGCGGHDGREYYPYAIVGRMQGSVGYSWAPARPWEGVRLGVTAAGGRVVEYFMPRMLCIRCLRCRMV